MKARSGMRAMLASLTLGLCGGWLAAGAAPRELEPEEGETVVAADAVEGVLRDVQGWFQKQPCFKARIVSEIDDLMPRVEKGELIVQRPDRILRRFTDPAVKADMLDGVRLRTYDAKRKKVIVRNFAEAPKALALLKAGAGLDISMWRDFFEVAAFKRPAAEGQPVQWRFVLTPLKDKKTMVSREYKLIQIRLAEGAAMFSEMVRFPSQQGLKLPVTERITSIKVLENLSPKDFKDERLDGDDTEKQSVTDQNPE